MIKTPFSRLFNNSPLFINSFRNVVSEENKLDRLFSHVYRKTWTKNQLIDHIKNNIFFKTYQYIVTNLPQGIALKKTSTWADSVTPLTAEADLNEILKELPDALNTEPLFLALYPTRNSSGLTIFARTYSDKTYLKSNLILAASNKEYCFSILAVVLGCPEQTVTQKFGIVSTKIEDSYCTEVLKIWKESKDVREVYYRHNVLESSPLASLVKVEVSQNVRDCVRHILGTQFSTPVLGDVWNCLKKETSFAGTPLAMNPAVVDVKSVSLDPELLAKLDLQPGDESLIPIHVHLQRLRVQVKNKTELFLAVPPPESFVWTCKQLGLNEIEKYLK